jgi:MFS family permease
MLAPSRRLVIATLGVTQIFAWGSSYYLPAVLSKPIAADTDFPLPLVVGGLSLGLLAASVVSPHVGALIERHGGRPVLVGSSLLLAAGLVLLELAHSLPAYLLAWLVMGLGMGAGLYDAAFATLGRAYGEEAHSAITPVTLWAGFSSTVCWPLSAYLSDHLGWRGTCFAYAALQLALALPAHFVLLPPLRPAPVVLDCGPSAPSAAPAGRAFLLLAGVVTIGGAVSAVFSVHVLTLLQARGLDLATAVALGALVGPSQVGARVLDPTSTVGKCNLLRVRLFNPEGVRCGAKWRFALQPHSPSA